MIRRSMSLARLAIAPLLRRGNRWTRKAAWRQEAAFWFARERFDWLQLKFLSVLLRHRRSLGEGATAVVVARGLARAIFFPALLAAAFVALLVWLDHYSLSFSLLDGFGDAGRATPLQPVLAAVERALGGWARALAFGQPVEQAHAALLVTGAQVTAAFLGFYFAAISVVAGTAYGNVPPDLRSVLIEDQVGNFYLHLVGFTGAACLFALGTLALGYSLGAGSAFAFAILGAASVLSFLPLGKRVFRFLDPEAVTASLAKDIGVAVSAVAGSGALARNRSIQAHHQKVAASKLQAWEELVAVSASRFHSASALRVIGQNAARLLLQYSRAKLTVARTSLWFRPAYAHPSYLTAGYSQLVSFGAAGALQPTLEPDHLWMEKRLGDILRRVVTALLERDSEEACTEVLGAFQRWIDVSAEQLDAVQLEAGFSIASDLGGGSGWASLGTPEGKARDHMGRLALLDGIAGTIPAAVAALYRRLSAVSLDELVSDALQMTGRHSRSFAGLPPTVRTGVETFRDQHAFERDVEGSVGTPAWFVEHHVARFLSVDLGNTFTLLLSQSEQWLPSHAKLLRENREIEGAATVIRRGMESVRKLEAAAAKTQSALEDLRQRRVSAAGEEWPTYSCDDWTERLRSLRLALVDELVSLTPHLSSASPKGDVPDSFGFAYTTLAYEAIAALEKVDAATFERIYPTLLVTALRAHDRVRLELAESAAENMLFLSAEVMRDLFEISGYAYLWTYALGEDQFWKTVSRGWDGVLAAQSEPSRLIEVIVLGETYRESMMAASPRFESRFRWKNAMRCVLEDGGFAPRGLTHREDARIVAIDPLSDYCVRNWDMNEARNLMLSEYILKRPEAQGLEPPRSVRNLRSGAALLVKRRAAGAVGRW